MEYDLHALERRLQDKDTKYIVIYPDPGIDIVGFTQELRELLNVYHTRGQGWTLGSNIELEGIPLVEAASEDFTDEVENHSMHSYSVRHPGI